MEQLLALFLGGGVRLPLFDPDLLALDRELPRSELLALLLLQRRGEATMSELAADLGAPLSTATGIGARLYRRGLVQRERHPGDRRIIVVRLTAEGQELAGRVGARVNGALEQVRQALSPAEFDQLITLLRKVVGAFQQSPAPAPSDGKSRRIPLDD